MASSPSGELEDLTLCSCCRRAFDEGEQRPKVLSCKHHFCLKCVSSVLLKGRELYCLHCWKRTELQDARPDSLPTHGGLLALARRLADGSLPPAPPAADDCAAHGLPMSLWCAACDVALCRGCAGHAGHGVQPAAEARASLRREIAHDLHHMHRLLDDLQRLVFRQRDFLLKILEACTTLKTQLETELVNNPVGFEVAEAREALESARRALAAEARPAELRALSSGLTADRERLQARHRDMFLQCRLDDLIRGARVALNFELLKRALADMHSGEPPPSDDGYRNPVLFLANYCMSQLYSRHCLIKRHEALAPNGNGDLPHSLAAFAPQSAGKQAFDGLHLKPNFVELANNNIVVGKPSPLSFGEAGPGSPVGGKSSAFQTESLSLALPSVAAHSPQPLMRNPTSHTFPLFYFNIEVNGSPFGRIVIEVRNDVAPKMARNFSVLTTGEFGIGYKGCSVFQCWENESVITGDFELNNGRGGRSVFEESYFMPDDTKMVAVRGSVGMRRSQKRHDNLGLVGSQFRVILREMRGFTGIFAFVAEGLELVDRLSQTGDSAGKPHSNIVIASCERGDIRIGQEAFDALVPMIYNIFGVRAYLFSGLDREGGARRARRAGTTPREGLNDICVSILMLQSHICIYGIVSAKCGASLRRDAARRTRAGSNSSRRIIVIVVEY